MRGSQSEPDERGTLPSSPPRLESIPEVLAAAREGEISGENRRVCGRLRDPEPRVCGAAAGLDADGDEPDRAERKRAEDQHSQRARGGLRLFGLHVWASLVVEKWPQVHAARPSPKSLKRLRQSVHDLLRPSLCDPWEDVRDQLNQKLVGWQNYFHYGSVAKAYQAVNLYVYDRVRHFLLLRHKLTSSKGEFPVSDHGSVRIAGSPPDADESPLTCVGVA